MERGADLYLNGGGSDSGQPTRKRKSTSASSAGFLSSIQRTTEWLSRRSFLRVRGTPALQCSRRAPSPWNRPTTSISQDSWVFTRRLAPTSLCQSLLCHHHPPHSSHHSPFL